jgi:hypothetical protein
MDDIIWSLVVVSEYERRKMKEVKKGHNCLHLTFIGTE